MIKGLCNGVDGGAMTERKSRFEGKELLLWHTGLIGTLRYQSRGVRLAGV